MWISENKEKMKWMYFMGNYSKFNIDHKPKKKTHTHTHYCLFSYSHISILNKLTHLWIFFFFCRGEESFFLPLKYLFYWVFWQSKHVLVESLLKQSINL